MDCQIHLTFSGVYGLLPVENRDPNVDIVLLQGLSSVSPAEQLINNEQPLMIAK
jgi:hypothetical protein